MYGSISLASRSLLGISCAAVLVYILRKILSTTKPSFSQMASITLTPCADVPMLYSSECDQAARMISRVGRSVRIASHTSPISNGLGAPSSLGRPASYAFAVCARQQKRC